MIAIKKGRIYFDGPKEKNLTTERMRELFEMPVSVERVGEYYRLSLDS